jgi:hypothetical protein
VLHFGNLPQPTSAGNNSGHSAMPDVAVEGAMLEGASWNPGAGAIELSEELNCPLPTAYLRWSHKAQRDGLLQVSAASAVGSQHLVALPLYLTSQRTTLVAEVLVAVPSSLPKQVWAQRGVAVVFQSNL